MVNMYREMPTCPVCGEECNEFYVSYNGREVVGCERCIFTESAEERMEEDRQDREMDYRYERS